MTTDTPESLLEAVGITVETGGTCPSGHRLFMGGEYTGPALGTPELDAVLWVEGQRWCRDCHSYAYHVMLTRIEANHMTGDPESHLLTMHNPGHALAAAIKEVAG